MLSSCSLYKDTFQRGYEATPIETRSLTPQMLASSANDSLVQSTVVPSATLQTPTAVCSSDSPECSALSIYEILESFQSSEILRSAESGKGYLVENPIAYDGLNYYLIINSEFGKFEAYGLPEFYERLSELDTISKLVQISSLHHAGVKAGEGFVAPFKAAKHLALNPVSSVRQIPATIEKLYDKAGDFLSRVKHTSQKAYAAVAGTSKKKAAAQDSDLEQQSDQSSLDPQDQNQKREELAIQAAEFAKDYSDDYIGYAQAKRELAKSVNADPYSNNPFIQRELVRLSRWQIASGISLKFLPLPSLPGIGIAAKVDSVLWSQDEESLVKNSFNQLSGMDIPAVTIRRFLANKTLTRSEIVKITQMLLKLEKVEGLADYVKLLSLAESPSIVRYYLDLTNYYSNSDISNKITRISTELGAPIAITTSKKILIFTPFDRLAWIEPLDLYTLAVAKWSKENNLKVELLYTGIVSPKTEQELKKRNIKSRRVEMPAEDATSELKSATTG